MTTKRKKLAPRRNAETIQFEHAGKFRLTASIGRFEDTGEVAEVFVHLQKSGTDIESILHDCCIAVSRSLQHGDSLEGLRAGMKRDAKGNPSSPIGALLDKVAECK
jgi:hypothetical protein